MLQDTATPPPLPLRRERPFDPPDEYARLRSAEPVSRLSFPDGKIGWLVTRYEDVRRVLTDPRFSSRKENASSPVLQNPFSKRVPPGMFVAMDPPDHTRYRRLLAGLFTVRKMRGLAGRIQQIVDDHLDAMARGPRPADLVAAFAMPVPALVMCELLGVPYDDRADFQSRTTTLLSLDSTPETVQTALAGMREYMDDLVRRKQDDPGEDVLSHLLHAQDPEDNLPPEEVSSIGSLMLFAGYETTANMLGLGTLTLLRHPDQLAGLKADPAEDALDRPIEELLRYLTIAQVGLVRVTTEDVELGGRRIAAGETVVLSLSSANRDGAAFDDPDRLDLSRRPETAHLAFGYGIHQCLGQQLVRVEMRIGLRSLFTRFPNLRLAVELDQIRMRGDMSIYGVHELPVTWDD